MNTIKSFFACVLVAVSIPFTSLAADNSSASYYSHCASTHLALRSYLTTLRDFGVDVKQDGIDASAKAGKIYAGLALAAYKAEGRNDGADMLKKQMDRKIKATGSLIDSMGIAETGKVLKRQAITCLENTDKTSFSVMAAKLGM